MSELSVRVWRGKATGNFETFAVPRQDAQTVLDVVTYIQRRLDPTLAYRFACRVGICGSCAMTVNCKPCWMCRIRVTSAARGDHLECVSPVNLPCVMSIV